MRKSGHLHCRVPHACIRRPSHHAAQGQSLAEFALTVPVFLFFLFCCLELGMYFKTHAAYQEAIEQAARISAAAGTSSTADTDALNALASTLGPEDISHITSVTVYDATASGAFAVTPTTSDNAHTDYVPSHNQFIRPCSLTASCTGISLWSPSTRSTTAGALDHIGIKVVYTYSGVTGLLPSFHLTESTMVLMEPTTYG